VSVFTDHVPLTPFLLIIAGVAVWMGLSTLHSILVTLHEIKSELKLMASLKRDLE
jgi:hypothetical protein